MRIHIHLPKDYLESLYRFLEGGPDAEEHGERVRHRWDTFQRVGVEVTISYNDYVKLLDLDEMG